MALTQRNGIFPPCIHYLSLNTPERSHNGSKDLGLDPTKIQASTEPIQRHHKPKSRLQSVSLLNRCVFVRLNILFCRDSYPLDQVVTRTNLESAIVTSPADSSVPIQKRFIIGGAEIYSQSLSLSSVNRILITRIISPSFEQCDVFMPEFRTTTQVQTESTAEGVLGPVPEEGEWRKCSYDEMDQWLGFPVTKGINEEKGIQYVFQMWERR